MRHGLRVVLLALAAPLTLAAQIPGAAPIKASPIPGLTTGPKSPDLVVTMGAGSPFPSSFTVKNQGNQDAGVSVLKVSATLLPMDGLPPANCPPLISFVCETEAQATAAAYTPERLRSLCGNPFADVLEAIPPLKAGESKTVSKDTSRFGHLTVRVHTALGGSQPGTHLKVGVTTLVCAFDVAAQADASNQVSELREDNNTTTLRVYREVRIE